MKMKKLIVLLMSAVMILSSMSLTAFADETSAEEKPTAGTLIPYGLYEPSEFAFEGGTGRVKLTCPRVHVTNKVYADITFSSKNYIRAEVDGVTYLPVVDEEAKTSTFTVPVNIYGSTVVSGTTVAMGNESTIDYTCTVRLDRDNLKAVERKALQDGYYTTEVNSDKATYGYQIGKDGTVTYGFSYPKKDYSFSVTTKVEGGKIVDVAYTKPVLDVVANTSSDINYLMWAMDGHDVTDTSYNYLAAKGKNYEKYNLDPKPAKNGTGMKDQIIAKNGTTGVDTVTAATITSRAIIDSVDKSLDKAEQGLKDDPEPVLPTPDTSEDVIPEDGDYTVKAKDVVGFDLGNDNVMLINVKDGKMTAKFMYVEQRQSSYPYIFAGTEKEALMAGEDAWLKPVDYDYDYYTSSGTYAPGSLYKDVPLKSLDKPLCFVMFASGSGNWFNRLFTLDSATLDTASATEVAMYEKMAETDTKTAELKTELQAAEKAEAEAKKALEEAKAEAETAKAEAQAAEKAEAEAKKALEEAKAETETAKSETETAKADVETAKAEAQAAQEKVDELEIRVQQVAKVKTKAAKKKATVSWKSLGSGYKYEVYVSTKVNSGFKKKATASKAKAVIKKLKSKKTYYFKVRGLKTVNGKTVYTTFSDIATAKIK